MTMIRLDAASAGQLRAAAGPVVFCDEAGEPVRVVMMANPDPPDREPDLSDEEWARRANDPVRYSTAQVLDVLRRLGGK